MDAGSASPISLLVDPTDDAVDDELLLTWWDASGAPTGQAWVAVCEHEYHFRAMDVFPRANGSALVASRVEYPCELRVDALVSVGAATGNLQAFVARQRW